jgi:hypothetical protein
MSYPTPDPSSSPDDLQLLLDKWHIEAARATYRENKGAERTVYFAIGQQVSGTTLN